MKHSRQKEKQQTIQYNPHKKKEKQKGSHEAQEADGTSA